jgi:hypothetical protein
LRAAAVPHSLMLRLQVSYIEFQRSHQLTIKLHTDALIAQRSFWQTLLRTSVSFSQLSDAVQCIEATVRASERMYRQVLARYSGSVKIIDLYVKFLQGVRNDPWAAARWGAELEKLVQAEEDANERCDDLKLCSASAMDGSRVITLSV